MCPLVRRVVASFVYLAIMVTKHLLVCECLCHGVFVDLEVDCIGGALHGFGCLTTNLVSQNAAELVKNILDCSILVYKCGLRRKSLVCLEAYNCGHAITAYAIRKFQKSIGRKLRND